MKRYEALIALDTRGKEDTTKDTIERLEKTFSAEGAVIEQVQRLEKRELAYESNHTHFAYYVNFVFEAEPRTIDIIRQKLKFDEAILLQNFLQLSPKKPTAPAAA